MNARLLIAFGVCCVGFGVVVLLFTLADWLLA